MQTREVVIHPPLRGTWAIYNPPGHPVLAFDFLAVDEARSLYRRGNFLRHLVSFIPVADTHTWSQPVYSPVDGVVVAGHDGETDREKISFIYDLFSLLIHKPAVTDGFGAFGGNHVLIRADGFYVLLCHLRNGSVEVKSGDPVVAGQQVGEVGNSGSSIQPHLHVQVMSNERYFPLFANLLPFRLSRAQVRHDDHWHAEADVEPRNRAHYRFDPGRQAGDGQGE